MSSGLTIRREPRSARIPLRSWLPSHADCDACAPAAWRKWTSRWADRGGQPTAATAVVRASGYYGYDAGVAQLVER